MSSKRRFKNRELTIPNRCSILFALIVSLEYWGRRVFIQFGIEKCALGLVLVAKTEKGICCIELDDSSELLKEALQQRFPNATVSENYQALEAIIANIAKRIENSHECSTIPEIDMQGTPFQLAVWNELRKIPTGTTVTYTDIASRLNNPQAVRAVASAIASNKIAVLVPCHRVVRKGGEISGYRWGVERKRKLLQCERIHS